MLAKRVEARFSSLSGCKIASDIPASLVDLYVSDRLIVKMCRFDEVEFGIELVLIVDGIDENIVIPVCEHCHLG